MYPHPYTTLILPHLPSSLTWSILASWRAGNSLWEQSPYCAPPHWTLDWKMTFSIQPTHVRVTQQALSTSGCYLSEYVILNVAAWKRNRWKLSLSRPAAMNISTPNCYQVDFITFSPEFTRERERERERDVCYERGVKTLKCVSKATGDVQHVVNIELSTHLCLSCTFSAVS